MAERIPEGITREHITAAIQDLRSGVSHDFGESTRYDLLFGGVRYPPKAVVGLAAGKLTGVPLGPYDFKGGLETACFRILRENGFEVVSKTDAPSDGTEAITCWWVNHKQTFTQETTGNYVWSPTVNRNGTRNAFYDNLPRIGVGDTVISYANGAIRALGTATGKAALVPRPEEFGTVGNAWNNEGWKVPVDFKMLSAPIRPTRHMQILRPTLPRKYSPIQENGFGNQGAYLSAVPPQMFEAVKQLLGTQWREFEPMHSGLEGALEREDDAVTRQIEQRTDIGPTERQRLIMSRRGQGVFRRNLEALELGCRITGLRISCHLRASHIKPWRACNDFEKLDGNNGLLLSPHMDHLFDQGFISFTDDGRLLKSPELSESVALAWGLLTDSNYGPFRKEQVPYLNFHREFVFSKRQIRT